VAELATLFPQPPMGNSASTAEFRAILADFSTAEPLSASEIHVLLIFCSSARNRARRYYSRTESQVSPSAVLRLV
jgi:hypothetical protein